MEGEPLGRLAERIVDATRRAAPGETLIVGGQRARTIRWQQEVGARWKGLTEREREVLRSVANGQSNKQIAAVLGVSEHTVETHVGNLLGKLGVASRTEAIAWAWQHGLIEEDKPSGGNPPDKNPGFPG